MDLPSESLHFTQRDFDRTTRLLVRAISMHSADPWKDVGSAPEDMDAISQVLSRTLQAANSAIASWNAYDCFDIPKGNGKVRRIESPDGAGAFEAPGQWFLEGIESSLEHIRATREKSIRAILSDAENYAVYDEKLEGVDDFAKLRHILAPREGEAVNVVRQAQKAINFALSPTVPISDSACGFRYGSGAYSGLRNLLDRFYFRGSKRIGAVYQIDIRNFFPSITTEMVSAGLADSLRAIVSQKHFSSQEIQKISALIAHIASYEGRLPQGGHTSPFLSNIFAQWAIDMQIRRLLRDHQTSKDTSAITMNYGRYADDIVILSDAPISEALRKEIDAIVEKNFQIAEEKRVYQEGEKQYTIWGASLLPDRYEKLEKWDTISQGKRTVGNFRFKLPKRLESRTAAYVFQATEQISHIRPGSGSDTGVEHLTRQVLGHLSHAYNISRFGGVVAYEQYCLPQRLAHAWEKFRTTLSAYYGREMYPDTFRKRG